MASEGDVTDLTAEEALRRLVEGNERFRRGETRPTGFCPERAVDLARSQRPFATILGCSDSRVPPEQVFDVGKGDLFVIRVAGNVFSPEIAGSLQYAGSHLRTPLFVVLGHEGCGAVSAAMAAKNNGKQFGAHIQTLLGAIVPGLPEVDAAVPEERRLSHAVEQNVQWTVWQILQTPEAQARQAEGWVRIMGAIYEIETGRVRFLPREHGLGNFPD
jgi:carbonic anhydrase